MSEYLNEIAIIGMAGRFPGASTIEEFWNAICAGQEMVTQFSDQELLEAGVSRAILDHPDYVRARAILDGIELFDASFFGFSPREAEVMDPQHRLFLECAHEALENSGYSSDRSDTLIGVYAGSGINTYFLALLSENPTAIEALGRYQSALLSEKDHLTTRVSYKLNLKGPSIDIQTSCSTSLVSVHVACQSLLHGECDIALAGGVRIQVPHKEGYLYKEGGISSPDGHCRAFDEHAQGTVSGNGLGVVVLKRMVDALEDGDTIHAVIKGSAINNDGALKVGYTAPSIEGQAEVITEALSVAGVEPETIEYVEAHGTGTTLGDPIEISALTRAFHVGTAKQQFCAIGSVKTNIGHLDAASGMAGLFKAVMALKHQLLPASLHYTRPNPRIDFAQSPFYVNTTTKEWRTEQEPRRAGVSSFGIGGTNAHIILEEAPPVEPSGPSRSWQIVPLSAKTPSALHTLSASMLEYLQQHPDVCLADLAYTLQVGRKGYDYRQALVCSDIDQAVQILQGKLPDLLMTQFQEAETRSVAFLFPGQGVQYVHMGAELYRSEPVFRQQIDWCADFLQPYLGLDLRTILYPEEGREEEARQQLEQTWLTQPALFMVEYALAQCWMQWGVRPGALLGHSIGEYVAACLAHVFTLEDALILVALRGRLMQQLPQGAMLSVPLSVDQLKPLLPRQLSLAAINGPSLCVVSGPLEAMEMFERQLAEQQIASWRLHTSHAFHSTMMDPIVDEFTRQISQLRLNPPTIPFLSNVTGNWITEAQATDPRYWTTHLRAPVRFAENVQVLQREQKSLLLEVGPGQVLSTLARQCQDDRKDWVMLSSLPAAQERTSDVRSILTAISQLWLLNAPIDWPAFSSHEKRHRIPLPTYPFERQRYWFASEKRKEQDEPARQRAQEQKKANLADWFYVPIWKQTCRVSAPLLKEQACWMVFLDTCGIGSSLVNKLEEAKQRIVTIHPGKQYARLSPSAYVIDPMQKDDYQTVFATLAAEASIPQKIMHLWNVTTDDVVSAKQRRDDLATNAFFSLLYLAQAIGEQGIQQPLYLGVVANHLHEVTGEEKLSPEKSLALGPCKVIPQEYPSITCRCIDITVPAGEGKQQALLINQLIAECEIEPSDPVVAYRGTYRWAQTFEAIPPSREAAHLREKGVYLITGGLGGIGLTLAEYLAETVQAKLVLVGRSFIPPREAWDVWLATHDDQDGTSIKIRKLLSFEALGAEVLVVSADVTAYSQMQALAAQIEARFGALHGIVHAAGVADGGIIFHKDAASAAEVLAPKVTGTRVLEDVFGALPLDFLILCSSLSSIYGNVGQVSYSAANAFLNAFAYYHIAKSGIRTIALDWDAWQEVGMAVNTPLPDELQDQRRARLQNAIRPDEGKRVFGLVSGSQYPQLIISTRDLQIPMRQNTVVIGSIPSDASAQVSPSQPAPASSLPEAEVSVSEVEQQIAALWQEVLGIPNIGVHRTFFELGGHSLTAITLIGRVRELFQVELPLHTLFENPTIAGMTQEVLRERGKEPTTYDKTPIRKIAREETTNDLLMKLDQLSDAELDALLQDSLEEKEMQK
jgi:acyl transferase domain-containing protein/acyl carrier protein